MSETALKDYLSKTYSQDKWRRIGAQRRAGILAPLFSVYSQKSLGIGDFADLKLLIDWCSLTGNSILQLLPLNEVGGIFCPYDAISSFALEPAYLSVEMLAGAKNKFILERARQIKNMFPAGKSPYVDYGIKQEKVRLLWEIFLKDYGHACRELARFWQENKYWVGDFALFKVLKDHNGGKAWYEWEDRYRDRHPASLEAFSKEHEKELKFQVWVQWQLYRQFKAAKEHAAYRKVLLKGDLPILVSRDSADVWMRPEFFKLDFAAGAPPDMYCAKGQRWGMPVYAWEKIAADRYRYLKEKLRYAENFYDILRIDHVVGLFRIWSIPYSDPLENQGLHGFFDPPDENIWEEHGRNILSVMLDNTKMLLCAEDLGIIPKVCPRTLAELGIPGNDVQRWAKDWQVRHDFLSPQEYRLLSVAMLSTHDTTNLAAWWEDEAGTVDEDLFSRKCRSRGIDYHNLGRRLFDPARSRYARLRWRDDIYSPDDLAGILGRRKEEIADFIELYENTYQEKEKLWKHLKLSGPMREGADSAIIRAALRVTLESRSLFCIQLIWDWLSMGNILPGDSYQYRVNTPGTISQKNWSLVIPLSLESLLGHRISRDMRDMVVASGRI